VTTTFSSAERLLTAQAQKIFQHHTILNLKMFLQEQNQSKVLSGKILQHFFHLQNKQNGGD
jgi:hypothetical protein